MLYSDKGAKTKGVKTNKNLKHVFAVVDVVTISVWKIGFWLKPVNYFCYPPHKWDGNE
jgi:hypothetical protein